MPQSPSLGFELLTSNQDSKHVTVNASALILEAVSIGVVVDQVNTPPVTPTNGQLYIVGAAGTGAFLGQNNKLALYDSTTWYFYSPKTNQTLYNTALASYVRFGGSTWTTVSLGGSSSPTTTEGDIIVRGSTMDQRLPIGTNGQVLTVDTSINGDLKWATPSAGTTSPTTTKGDLIVRDATTDVRQPVGVNGQVLTADSTVANGLKWATPVAPYVSPTTTKGDLIVRDNSTDVRQPVGTNGQILTADSAEVTGVKWVTPSSGSTSPTTTKGDLIVRNATIDVRQPVGADGQVLTADSAVVNGLKWATPSSSPTTTAGDLIVRNATVDQRLPIGSNGSFLVVDTALPEKIKWVTPPVSAAGNYIQINVDGAAVPSFGTTPTDSLFGGSSVVTGSPGLTFNNVTGVLILAAGASGRWRYNGVIFVQSSVGTRFQFSMAQVLVSTPAISAANVSIVGGGVVTAAATPTPVTISGFLDLPVFATNTEYSLQVRASAAASTLSATNAGAAFPIVSRVVFWKV